ncbi:hypothetical protein B0H16DRAFT_1741916 [Mycena metata]|uniref:Uncharacterized protein n=1 Tax=Mycena metata TaxID=1033252 RepID=A0AAD7MFM2_9AGAR|nr:hypothetical protein B0H16DRAFT_1746648 [Mycena metata]KAJ7715474.1 hypothetical protein B0H16DRAFT_1741916 [Mycena metata]
MSTSTVLPDATADLPEDMEGFEQDVRAYLGRKLRRREASKAYNDRNRDVRNHKKQERMAILRASRVGEPSSLAAERQVAAREAARVYRENNREALALKERRRRRISARTKRLAAHAFSAIKTSLSLMTAILSSTPISISTVNIPATLQSPSPVGGDLEKGEHFANTTYLEYFVDEVSFSYDVASFAQARQNNNTYSDLLFADMQEQFAAQTSSVTAGPPSPAPGSVPLPVYFIDSRTPSPILHPTVPDTTAFPTPSPIPSRPPSPAASGSPSPPPYNNTATTGVHPQPVYAVRVGREGEVFRNFRAAWTRYLALDRQGETVALVVANSVVRALAWIENAPLAEEREILYREIVQEAIASYRAEDPDSSLDDSEAFSSPDEARSTAELVAELDAREARAHWRRMS